MTVNWTAGSDDTSAQADLEYLVYYSTSDNIDTAANAVSNGTAAGSFSANISSKAVSGLTGSTTYYFNVLVKDEAGNTTAYTSSSETTSAAGDSTAPTAGGSGVLSFSSVNSSSLTVNWTAGTDNVTAQANLQYLVYYSASNNIASVSNAETNGTAVGSYSSNITTKAVTGLSASTTYYFNVIIKDEAGNKTAYTTNSQATSAAGDSTAPTAGGSGVLSFSSVNSSGLTVNWTVGTDNVTAQANLQYLLYYSTSNNIAAASTAEANGTAVGAYVSNIATKSVTGLSASTTYYFNVIVKDEAGNKTAYSTNSQSTDSAVVTAYEVSGYDEAGLSTHGNGTYSKISDYNGKVAYQFDNSALYTNEIFTIRWETLNSRWEIYNSSYDDWDYYNLDTGDTPPTSGWYKWGAESSPDLNLTLTAQ